VGDIESFILNYNQCKIDTGEINIRGDIAVGRGVTLFSNLQSGRVIMPSPVQPLLRTTVGSNCNAEWTLTGSSDITIMGSQLGPQCKIIADGDSDGDSDGDEGSHLEELLTITLDFGIDNNCTGNGYDVLVSSGIMTIKNKTTMQQNLVEFDSSFANLVFIMSSCNDTVSILNSYNNAQSIEILTGRGDDLIKIGTDETAFDETIFAPIVSTVCADCKNPYHLSADMNSLFSYGNITGH